MATLPHEEWRDIPGYEGAYQVSSLGRVKSLDRVVQHRHAGWHTVKGRILAQTPDWGRHAYGRLTVKLSLDGKARTKLVHQLVAAAFIGLRPDGMQVAHNDGDPTNNRPSNLRYATSSENTSDKARHGTVLRGADVGNSKLNENQVRLIRTCELSVTKAAKAFGVSIAQISRIRSGTRWGHVV